jgi:cytochrome c553
MKRSLLIIIGITASLLFIFGTGSITFAVRKTDDILQKHLDTVKQTNPQKYQEMFQKAQGNITSCLSCHGDIFKETNSLRRQPRR